MLTIFLLLNSAITFQKFSLLNCKFYYECLHPSDTFILNELALLIKKKFFYNFLKQVFK